MTDFEFVFSLFGLLLGFSLIEVLGGLAKVIEAQLRAVKLGVSGEGERPFRAGWLIPLLGLFVMLDIISFWGSAWVARGQLVFSGPVVVGGLLFAGAYYMAAHLVFPTERDDWADLDAHYLRVRRVVFGAILALTTLQLAYMLTIPDVRAALGTPAVIISAGAHFALLIVGLFVRNRRASIAVLALLILRYLFQYLT
jgi:hypothetical protein